MLPTSSPNGSANPVDRFLHVYLCGERHECTLRDRLIGRAISIATRSPWVHVAVGHSGAVASIHGKGPVYWPQTVWEQHYPARMLRYEIPSNHLVDLDGPFISNLTGMDWRSVANWMLRGRGGFCPADCVSMGRSALFFSGLYVPKTVTTPAQLKGWLDDHGFGHTEYRVVPGRFAASVEGSDRSTGELCPG